MLIGKKILTYGEIDSTNDEAKRLIKAGAHEGTVIIAESQKSGRGKPGSQWFSPKAQGLYLSVILKPLKDPQKLDPLVLLGAKAAVEAIKETCRLKAEIKEPNDIMISGKKIGGVLVERVDTSSDIPSVIIGVGLNLNIDRFPDELKNKAASLKTFKKASIDIKGFTSALLKALDQGYLKFLKGGV